VEDNNFTAGDPWGLPVEEPDEVEVEKVETEPTAAEPAEPGATEPDSGIFESSPEPDPVAEAGESTDRDATETLHDSDGFLDEPSAAEEATEERSDWEETQPDTMEEESSSFEAGSVDQEADEADEEYTFTAPSRTPLSQMIAAAQSVVSSVQGDEPDTEVESTDEPVTELPQGVDEGPAEDWETPLEATVDEEDLPKEPPPWLIVDETSEGRVDEGDQPFSPEDIEESIAELADQEVSDSFAEDHMELPGESEFTSPEDALGDVDLDSSPGVYQELTDLAEQDAQAESLLQEAAAAFGGEDEDRVGFEGDIEQPEPEELEGDIEQPEPEELEGYVEALATELRTDDATSQPIEDESAGIVEETEIAAAEIDSFAEAFATELGSDATTEETPEWQAEEQTEIDSLAEALATELGSDATTEETPEWQAEEQAEIDDETEELATELEIDDGWQGDFIEETELVEAVAGLPDGAAVDSGGEAEEPPPSIADWDEESFELGLDAGETSPEPPSGEGEPFEELSEQEQEAPDAPAEDATGMEEPAAQLDQELAAGVIESPVTWGARYREAQQGWVDDEEGRSTWRPIVTSGESVSGWELDTYLGLVSGDVSVAPEGTENLPVGVSAAREDAVRQMLDDALARGAHAVVNVAFSVQEIAGAVHVAASGVAVTLRTPA
jgi:uncharacterized protein YbjQ (UPF0145 family)